MAENRKPLMMSYFTSVQSLVMIILGMRSSHTSRNSAKLPRKGRRMLNKKRMNEKHLLIRKSIGCFTHVSKEKLLNSCPMETEHTPLSLKDPQ
ncbi:hypothetical protein CDAR_421031 [Caerostris darwini]|uniref:Uncharacterized protein n=1 Tax=Caerostris darwini TaxID=1538125 RepID=A0AAV4NYE0_9ARAC|nr:hypothetical protein CDAR_421031 [Caerostris darwini]